MADLHLTPRTVYDADPDVLAEVAKRRRAASVPHVEDEPVDREDQPCWCTDFHRDVHLALTYCPRHGRAPDPELWDYSVAPFPCEAKNEETSRG